MMIALIAYNPWIAAAILGIVVVLVVAMIIATED